jgi:hypothetical protein
LKREGAIVTRKNKILPVAAALLIGSAIGGGVITYTANGEQKVAGAGFTSILWPTAVVTGKVVILGLSEVHR